jgi:hypothetical protein
MTFWAAGPVRLVCPARNGGRGVEAPGVLVFVAAGALVVGLATPVPAPKPTPTNPFNLIPVPPPSTLPVIGTTRSKPVCTAIRRAVAPAVAAAMKNDQTFGVLRKTIFDYVVKDSSEARDMHLMQMDHTVDTMVKNVDALEEAIKSSALDVPPTAKPEDAKTLRDLRTTLGGILGAEKTQLNVMSGFVETERMRRFGQLSETEQNMQRANNPNVAQAGGGPLVTPAPMGSFLRDAQDQFDLKHHAPNGLHDGHLLDHDLGEIIAFTSKYEDAASKVIIPAANSCK